MKKEKSKLTGVYLNKFQSIDNPVFINLEHLTMFYGPNSAGKSSIIDALEIIEGIVDDKKRKFNVGYIFRNSHSGNVTASLGVEIKVGNLNVTYDDQIKKWSNYPDASGDRNHLNFMEKLYGKKLQIEFSDDGRGLKIAIEGEPLFEICDDYTYYDDHHMLHDCTGENPEDEDKFIHGVIKFYKNNKWFNLINSNVEDLYGLDSKHRKSQQLYFKHYEAYHYDLFVQETDELLIINGLVYDLDWNLEADNVSLHYEVGNILFSDFNEDISSNDGYGIEAKKALKKIFGKNSAHYEKYKNQRNSLYWKLEAIAKDVNLIVEGVFHQIRTTLNFSHVKGDRRLLNSTLPMYSPPYEKLTDGLKLGSDYQHLSNYAEYLGAINNKTGSGWFRASPVIDGDFINHCLSKYLLSLRGYQVVPESVKISQNKNSEKFNEEEFYIEYLNIKNSSGKVLGFEDVGSGISYIMPILTSLWASNFSIVEQPELHLHPKAQCELGDVFISAYSKGAAALIESHSEHLLLRLLRRVRETSTNNDLSSELKITANQLYIYYFDPQENGSTVVKRIRVDKYGELLDLWPGGFFSERDQELFS
jgi:predicted ATPase